MLNGFEKAYPVGSKLQLPTVYAPDAPGRPLRGMSVDTIKRISRLPSERLSQNQETVSGGLPPSNCRVDSLKKTNS